MSLASDMAAFETALIAAGASLNGIADDAAKVQSAINSVLVAGKVRSLILPPGLDAIKMNSGITIPMPLANIDWSGPLLDFSGMTSGTAISFTGQTIPPYNKWSGANHIRGLRMQGPDKDDAPVDGIKIGGTQIPGHATFENCTLRGFQDSLVIDDNTFLLQFRNFFSNSAHRYGLNYIGVVNTGESINFYGCSFSDTTNLAHTAVAINVPALSGGPDLIFHGTSFSYNDKAIYFFGGRLSCFGVHFESKNDRPFGIFGTTSGRTPTSVIVSGGVVSHGPGGLETEQAGGRAKCFVVDSGSGGRIAIAFRDVQWGVSGLFRPILLTDESASPTTIIEHRGIEINTSDANMPRLTNKTSSLYNGGFELGTVSPVSNYGWTVTPGSTTWSQDTVEKYGLDDGLNGSKSLKMVATTGVGSHTQDIRVTPGELVNIRGFAKMTAISAGGAAVKANFLAADGTSLLNATVSGDITSVRPWTRFSKQIAVPAGAATCRITILNFGPFNGTCYFDDIEVWLT